MELETLLLILVLVLELGIGAGVYILWRQGRSVVKERDKTFKGIVQEEMGCLERYLDGKVDLLLAQFANLQPSSAEAEERKDSRVVEESASEDSEAWPRQDVRPPSSHAGEFSETDRLALLLNTPDFCSGVWPQMDGPFGQASARLLGFLSDKGVAEPEVEPHPTVGVDYENHWDFLVVWSQDAGGEGSRFLIPRNFSRYDPAVHGHLFRVLGGGDSLENYIRELRECAVLRGSGPLQDQEFIEPKLVEKKGVLVV